GDLARHVVGEAGGGTAGGAYTALDAAQEALFVVVHAGVVKDAIDLPVTAVFVLTMTGAAVAGIFGAAATAPLARLVIDARAIIRKHAEAEAANASGAPPPA
ncbi:MAG TPA: hypothetical protein VF308_05000, partial [Caldimonas sp.]